jgi:ATP-binding cassette, subfamily G (WHITE), member 2
MYTAALRMPTGTTLDERKERVREAMKTMGIYYCRNVIVGDSRNKGISGGERKRLCCAMELLTRPKLLFLDEPTSGLDSTNALSLLHTLKDLSDRGECTVVCTIHQPQTKIYNLIDNLILMKRGEIVYQGACAMAEKYFEQMGYPCPEKTNPADHLLDIVTIGVNDEDKEEYHVKKLTIPVDMDFGLDKDDFTLRAAQPWVWQFFVLCHRNLMEKWRRWDIFVMNIFITCIVATFISCGAWYNVGRSESVVIAPPILNAILFFCTIYQGIVYTLQGTHAFPLERAIMLRERASGAYYVSAYFLSKTGIDTLFQLMSPIVFTA